MGVGGVPVGVGVGVGRYSPRVQLKTIPALHVNGKKYSGSGQNGTFNGTENHLCCRLYKAPSIPGGFYTPTIY